MKDKSRGNLRYRVNGTLAIKVQPASVYDFPNCEVPERGEGRGSHRMHDSLMQRSPVYRELRSGSCQGIAIPGVTLGQKLAAMLLATTLTAVAIALAYLV